MAEKVPTAVWLNLGDLEQLMDSLAKTAARGRRGRMNPEDQRVMAKIRRARDRRLRAVTRAARS